MALRTMLGEWGDIQTLCCPVFPVVQTLDSAIQQINHYPADNVIVFHNTYPLDSDLSSGQRYPAFEQPGPGVNPA